MKSKVIKRYGYVNLSRIIDKKLKPINNNKPKQDETNSSRMVD